MCAASNSLCGEWKLKRRTWRHQCNQLHFFQWKQLAVIFAHKSKSNTSFGTVKGLLYKTFYKIFRALDSFFPLVHLCDELSQLAAGAHHLVANFFIFFDTTFD